MEKKPNLGRRDFLKKTAVGAASLTAGMSLLKPAKAQAAWTNGMQINPNIDNLRVVTYYDEGMFTSFATASKNIPGNLSGQEALLKGATIESNMDLMAIKLAQKADAATSWAAIFRIPTTKTWATAQAAIKVNCVDTVNMPHTPIIGKICNVLITLGMPAKNITVFDSGGSISGVGYNSFVGKTIPTGVVVSQPSRGGSAAVAGFSNQPIWANLTNGTIDILVNIGPNKCHFLQNCGHFTITMKNHYGTFPANHGNGYLVAINQADPIIGGTPPRQQLCIVDSLWASVGTDPNPNNWQPSDPFNKTPARITMGTFSPIVDYLTAIKIRQPILGVAPQQPETGNILTSFGYSSTSPFQYFEIGPTPSRGPAPTAEIPRAYMQFSLSNKRYVPTAIHFSFLRDNAESEIKVTNLQGKLVQSFLFPSYKKSLVWDGTNSSGTPLRSGRYIVTLSSGGKSVTQELTVMKANF